MRDFSRTYNYESGQTCSICEKPADFEVVLYDFYDYLNETFYEQDFTCPFLCQEHLEINERDSKGERRARGYVHYPFTNQGGAQGYSKYLPIKEIYPEYFKTENENNKTLQIDLDQINHELISYLAQHPEYMQQLHHRKFEELIAAIFKNKGYEVTLTPQTRDGGKDIIAMYKSPFGHQMFVIECKKYKAETKVGVELVRNLYGVKTAERFNQGILVTTSTFTKEAKEFVKPLNFELELKDLKDITAWCKDFGNKR